jgi:hypothetical protein
MLPTRLALFAPLLPAAVPAALFHLKGSGERSPAITLRKRLHVNTLITQPGTMDIEWGGAFSTDGSFTFPTAIHFTPEGTHAWWGRTEFTPCGWKHKSPVAERYKAPADCVELRWERSLKRKETPNSGRPLLNPSHYGRPLLFP